MNYRKPFDAGLYAADDNAKHQVINWLERNDFWAWVNPDQFGVDVLALRDTVDYAFEVEVKHNWTGPVFPFDGVHFAERKTKFTGSATHFTMLNHERDHVLLAPAKVVRSSPIVEKSTRLSAWEAFIEVPLESCGVYSLDEIVPNEVWKGTDDGE